MSENDDSYTTNSRVPSARPEALGIATALLTTANGIAAMIAIFGAKSRRRPKLRATHVRAERNRAHERDLRGEDEEAAEDEREGGERSEESRKRGCRRSDDQRAPLARH